MHILLVEDDRTLGSFLSRGLSLDGHSVELVADARAAIEAALSIRPDVLLLDLGQPGEASHRHLAGMRDVCPSVPLLAVTAADGADERVRCLELGADDVVSKPFAFHELRARIKALGRRRGQFEERYLRFSDLEMDRAEHRVRRGARHIELTATEFSLLEALLRRGGEQVCTRPELLREVWRMSGAEIESGAGTNIVEVYINYLRGKLDQGARGRGKSLIQTIRGKGYTLAEPLSSRPRVPLDHWRPAVAFEPEAAGA